ncbi:MAG: hypothetical protein MZV63_57805 [Marinilabiliales bacterium]|nr:hypothetical protein [Marinilabiliales bacterium]
MVNAALIIGTARAILIVAQDGTDPGHHPGRVGRGHLPVSTRSSPAQLMFVSQCVINFFVHSGTAQAALTIPIMAPLGDLVGITRQTAVFAFQLAEYINPGPADLGRDHGRPGAGRTAVGKVGQVDGAASHPVGALRRPDLIPPVLMKWGPA